MKLSLNEKNRGFTLIELLVVVAIIGILTSLVFTSVVESRTRAKNSKRNEIARQYVSSFELYRNTNNNTLPTSTGLDCLGYADGVSCGGTATGDATLNNAIDDYYPSMPTDSDYVVQGISGIMYSSASPAYLMWFMDEPADCPHGATRTDFGSYVSCRFSLE